MGINTINVAETVRFGTGHRNRQLWTALVFECPPKAIKRYILNPSQGKKMQSLTTTDLIFPTASVSISAQFAALGKSHTSISNRLRSIDADSRFVRQVAGGYALPVIANERCGSWYIPPEIKAGSAYFKSTDGHHGVWSCSLRRLNLGVLDVVGGNGG